MNRHRQYLAWMFTLVGGFVLLLVATAWYLQPLAGDLTRIGGYTENQFGWNRPQQRFQDTLMDVDRVDRPYDVVVLGDSMSYHRNGDQTDPGSYWQNFFVNMTGLSLVTFHVERTGVEEVLKNPVFAQHPPKIVIYERVERRISSLPGEIGVDGAPGECDGPRVEGGIPSTVEPRPYGYATEAYDRASLSTDAAVALRGDRFSQASHYLTSLVLRGIPGRDRKVYLFGLDNGRLFSNRAADQLLVFKDDLMKSRWSARLVRKAYCSLLALQRRVQANGATTFVSMLVPDKLTAYADYIDDAAYRRVGKIPLLAQGRLNLPRLDLRVREALASGVVDLYLPNDTHWGSAGHELAAGELVRFLSEDRGGR